MEIKRCPFCGGEGQIWTYNFDGWTVDCENCGARTEIWSERDEAIERWNRRVGNEPDKQRTVEAIPAKRGEWVGKPIAGYSNVRCSACREVFLENRGKWNYCPNCGAKMEVE